MQIQEPLVSVVIPCYNHESFIQDSIQSVIDQTYQNIELIIIDDGSKDRSVEKMQEMISACKKRFVRFEFRFRPNKGLSTTLNEAIEWCEGKYLAAIASDDVILKDKTEVQVGFLEKHSDITAVFGGVKLIDDEYNELGIKLKPATTYSFESIIMHKFDLPAPTQMIRLESIRQVGGYDPDIILEDWYMWLKLAQNGQVHYMNQIFALYRQHDSNASKNLEKMLQGRIDVINSFKDSEHYSQALKKIEWLNARARYKDSEQDKNIWKLFSMRPFKTVDMLINDFIKKVKNKK